jgi:threonine dehydrogenase-like Zn-dependent dehydrogenase
LLNETQFLHDLHEKTDLPFLIIAWTTVESICSLISSGTELKIFNGIFEEAQPLDVGIEEMKHQTMAYPMGYGYSLVGRIRRCGSNVSSDMVGKLAFAFSCHSSRAVVHKDSIQLIPSGIAPEDAIFFPSVETALSVVHDANIRVGENVAVFGQGLIGLLVTHILCLSRPRSLNGSARFGTITVLDTMPDRLAVASLLGASQALLPPGIEPGSFFDVCIEVSGNERALQSAIDSACDGGRIIIASWYGNASVRLNLGTAFHRSHKTVIASQVSRIPGHLQMTWTKPRRFALTWELLRAMRPSRYLLTKTVEIVDAQAAYELLNAGKEIAVAIKY